MSTPVNPHQNPYPTNQPGAPVPPNAAYPPDAPYPAGGAYPPGMPGAPAAPGTGGGGPGMPPEFPVSIGGAPAGRPVGPDGTRVIVAERPAFSMGGAPALLLTLALLVLGAFLFTSHSPLAAVGVLCVLLAGLCATSLTVVNPGDAKVVQFFGNYKGTLRRTGLQMTMPFTSKRRISVKVNNFETNELKVNDHDGNPVNIAAIIVWQVADTARSLFSVENYAQFVAVQSESALRHIASSHPYDDESEGIETLRGSTDAVAQELADEVAARIQIAGLEVLEARIASLAYAPEIAQAMLQRQQASAVIAAREKIVEGAVSMVENALQRLEEQDIVSLDDERKAAMVSNLLVVLCSDSRATPVVNAGTLYQ